MPARFTPDRIVRFLLLTAVLAAGAWLVWFFSDLVVYLIVGAMLAYFLRPVVDRLEALGMRRSGAILLTFVGVIGAISFLLAALIPFLAEQVIELSALASEQAIRESTYAVERALGRVFQVQEGTLYDSLARTFRALFEPEWLSRSMSSIVDLFTNIFYAVVVIPFVTFFFLKDGVLFHHELMRLVPNRYFEATMAILAKIERNLGRYFKGLLVQITLVGAVATLMLFAMGLRGAVAVGIFTGVANTIPYFGPFLGLVTGTIIGIAQTGDFALVPGVLLAMTITKLFDDMLFQPLIFSRAARTHPLLILCVVLIGAELAGIVGMLVAIPVATTARVAVQQVLWSLRNYRIFSSTPR